MIGADHTVQRVNSPGTTRDADDSELSMHARIALSRHRRRLFMMIVETVQPRVMSERMVEMHRSAADNSKDLGNLPLG